MFCAKKVTKLPDLTVPTIHTLFQVECICIKIKKGDKMSKDYFNEEEKKTTSSWLFAIECVFHRYYIFICCIFLENISKQMLINNS